MVKTKTIATLAFAVATLLTLVAPAMSEDAFDSTAATGAVNSNTGNYTGSQTTQGGSAFAPVLQGATNGTIVPQSVTGAGNSNTGCFADSPTMQSGNMSRDANLLSKIPSASNGIWTPNGSSSADRNLRNAPWNLSPGQLPGIYDDSISPPSASAPPMVSSTISGTRQKS